MGYVTHAGFYHKGKKPTGKHRRAGKHRRVKQYRSVKGKIKPHKRIRTTCFKCGRVHSRSEHRSHNYGSYAMTH